VRGGEIRSVTVAGVDELRDEMRTTALRLYAEIGLHGHEAAQRLGIGGTDSRFLTLLDLLGPLTPGRLASLTGLTTGSVTGVIDRLERGGFVARERDGTDRRKVHVVLGRDASARLLAENHDRVDVLDEVLASRGPDELAVIARFLRDICEGEDRLRNSR
jgi:DNA-binding MarR family transcriptional regulator